VNGRTGLLDWYTISVGLFSAIALCAHGATYLALKTEGGVHDRSVGMSRRLWTAALLSFPAIAWMTWYVRRDFYTSLMARPAGWFAIAGLLAGGALLAAGRSAALRARVVP
jgi:cytochrome bd-type quinol oxidase subunit 2